MNALRHGTTAPLVLDEKMSEALAGDFVVRDAPRNAPERGDGGL
ncbi:MAG: hypothetical protein ACLUEQ_12265 [Cloacibacillus evryensis]